MRTLFVDFDGTICFDRFWQNLPENERHDIRSILFSEDTTLVNEWMRGKYTAEEITKIVSERTSLSYTYLWNSFVDGCRNFSVSQDILDAIAALRERFFIILMTGNMDSFDRFTAPALDLYKHFDLVINSFNEGLLKPDNGGELFLRYLEGDIKNAFLIEDAESSCKTFSTLGGTALRVTQEAPAISHLQQLLHLD